MYSFGHSPFSLSDTSVPHQGRALGVLRSHYLDAAEEKCSVVDWYLGPGDGDNRAWVG